MFIILNKNYTYDQNNEQKKNLENQVVCFVFNSCTGGLLSADYYARVIVPGKEIIITN